MATVTHYIYSHYDPKNAEKPEEAIAPEETWEQEAPRLNRLQGPAPYFVPASTPYDDWNSAQALLSENSSRGESTNALGTSISGWYRSLTSSRVPTPSSSKKLPPETVSTTGKITTTVDKNNWFIMNAIQSEPSSSTSTPSLAEMLDRDPPPLPSQKRYTPPVWLEIGPANKGFGLLQKAGWNEGEALGPAVVRRKPLQHLLSPGELFEAGKNKGKASKPSSPVVLRKETMEIKLGDTDDVTELRQIDVIDLSMCSDDAHSESGSSVEDGSINEEASPPDGVQAYEEQIPDYPAYEPKALLTPIPTVLKSDRLGIGLKAKTVGPYKASQKRVTHNAAALASHIKMAEESRRRKELFGRGRRGLERRHKKESERRQAMIAYLKSS